MLTIMKRSHLLKLILPALISAAAPPASCTSDEQCSVTQRSKVPPQSSTDVGLCGCYATSSIDPFDECEGNNTSCAQAKCMADACAGLTSSCSNSAICVLKLDEEATSTTQATTSQAPLDKPATMNSVKQQTFADDLTEILFMEPNECTSSLGISMAFSLVYPGATNDGITQMKNTFGYPDGSNLQLVWEGTTQRMLNRANGECFGTSFDGKCFSNAPLLKISNSVWLDSGDELNQAYASVVGDYVMQTDFESIESPRIVNDWVKNSTNGLIDSIVDPTKPLFPSDVLLAINSIYLKASWVEQFKDRNTNLDTFYASPSRTTKVAEAHFMHTVEYFDYSHDALMGYQIIKLRLQETNMSVILVLPLTDEAGTATSNDVINALDRLAPKKIALALPKFKFESKYDDNLKEALITLGVKAPFSEGTNSLCGLLQDYDCEKLIISKVIQKTSIDVNEKGLEAAAVSAVGVGVTSMPAPVDPILMVLDHPFQFFIYDREEDLMLFEGRLGEPEVPEKEQPNPLLDAKHKDSDFWSSNFYVDPIDAPLTDTTTSSTAAVVDCSVLTTCSECLENEGCAHWTADQCHADCFMDVSCYTNSGGFTGMAVDEICTKADDDRKDSALCGSMADCTSCVEAVKSDGKTCMWFEDGHCATGCNMSGCGSTDATTCSGGSTTSAQATIAGGAVGATTTLATVSQATGPADSTPSTTSTSSTAPVPVRNDLVSSGNTYNNLSFVCVCSTIFILASSLLGGDL